MVKKDEINFKYNMTRDNKSQNFNNQSKKVDKLRSILEKHLPIKKIIEKPINKIIEKPIKNTSMDKATIEALRAKSNYRGKHFDPYFHKNKIIKKPINKIIEKPIKKIIEKPIKKIIEKPIKKIIEKPIKKISMDKATIKHLHAKSNYKGKHLPIKKIIEKPIKNISMDKATIEPLSAKLNYKGKHFDPYLHKIKLFGANFHQKIYKKKKIYKKSFPKKYPDTNYILTSASHYFVFKRLTNLAFF
jgi:hypothetical protein